MRKHQSPLITVFGEVLFDVFPKQSVLGGAPFNVAWHLQAFGLHPRFISRVGPDEQGTRIQHAMAEWDMNTTHLQIDDSHPTGEVRVDVMVENHSFHIVDNQAYDFIEAPATAELDGTKGGQILYHGSLALRHERVRDALKTLKIRLDHPLIFTDINLRDPWWQPEWILPLPDDADWVKLNEDELRELHGPTNGPLEDQIRDIIGTHNLEGLIVTRAGKGALAMTTSGETAAVTPRGGEVIIDTVGAGDAFSAVFLAGLALQWPLDTAMTRAQEFARSLCGHRGATVSDIGFYSYFLNQWS